MSFCRSPIRFDIGLGAGAATTEIDGQDISSSFGAGIDEVAVNVGLKVGYGPISTVPVYIAATLEGIGHRFYDSSNYIQLNSYLLGPSIIVYPIDILQISGSVGYSWVANQSDMAISFYDSELEFPQTRRHLIVSRVGQSDLKAG